MSSSFDGNDGNDGNSANAGGAGNATSTSAGWFFADRVNLPLVTEFDTGPNAPAAPTPIGQLPTINRLHFPARNWSADWYSWLALNDFAGSPAGSPWQTIINPTNPLNPTSPSPGFVGQWPWPTWVPFPPPADWSGLNGGANVQGEIGQLVIAASNERADALAEILRNPTNSPATS